LQTDQAVTRELSVPNEESVNCGNDSHDHEEAYQTIHQEDLVDAIVPQTNRADEERVWREDLMEEETVQQEDIVEEEMVHQEDLVEEELTRPEGPIDEEMVHQEDLVEEELTHPEGPIDEEMVCDSFGYARLRAISLAWLIHSP
jgi:Zn ribbon nucleic-acid-binding protein